MATKIAIFATMLCVGVVAFSSQAQKVQNLDLENWTTYSSEHGMLEFEYPSCMSLDVQSMDPLGIMISDPTDQFAILIVLNENRSREDNYAESTIRDNLAGDNLFGTATEVNFETASGLRQVYQFRDGSHLRNGTMTALRAENGTVMFDVNHVAPSGESNFQAATKRILDSLSFKAKN